MSCEIVIDYRSSREEDSTLMNAGLKHFFKFLKINAVKCCVQEVFASVTREM